MSADYLALGGGLAVLVLIVAAAVWLAVRNSEILDRATHSEAIRATTTDIVTLVQDAETGQRGYLLTQREPYMEPYRQAARLLPARLNDLEAALSDDPEERATVRTLREAVESKLAELRQTVELAQAGRRDEALRIVESDRGKDLMDRIRGISGQLAARQRAQLDSQIAQSNAGARLLVVVDSVGLFFILILVAFLLLGLRRYLRWLADIRVQLAQTNEILEQTVATRTADLIEANQEVQRFAYIVSHDLRAPLVNIMGFTSELEAAAARLTEHFEAHPDAVPNDVRAAIEEDTVEALRFIKSSTAKMDRLIAAILRLSREGRRVLSAERLDMTGLLRGIVDSVQHQTAAEGIRIDLAALPPVEADRLAIEQVFSNLLENAIKYRHPDRPAEIRISGRVVGRLVSYDVADNGRGIAENDLERVFELFRRAGDQRVPGEGIGLAHVRALVRRMGGTIDCESELGVGSVFRVNMPRFPTNGSTAT